ncbi:hypothetical protein SAMN05443999_103303 [Roseovarius azorensis]|uniref:Dihydroorotate dehydrogenase n=1 Tax=Roseovarius azorensis TaxID=1287727 RepID=A0A1H7MG36_9RHOB|nr:hypothetical protein [Roseovarius azorensis]SEL10114.1 hypothetical protein SAMN05443999_103303 [Roseovarius azorensis]
MPMKDEERDMNGLEAYFDAARAERAAPSADLMARIIADAQAVQMAARSPAPRRRAGLGEQFYRLIGGWPAMAGLATAAVAGVWLGTSLPEGLLGPGEAAYLVDVTPELAFDLAGGDF